MELARYAHGRDNNFNLIRALAAYGVLVSHSFALATGDGLNQPLMRPLGVGLGTLAVDAFFITSGFLVTGSLAKRANFVAFGIARALRIYPALIVMVCLSVFVLGLLLTTGSGYFDDPRTYAYLRNAFQMPGSPSTLPGVFESNPYGAGVNGSLWTLPYEIKMYIALAALWLIARGRLRAMLIAACAACLAWHFASPQNSYARLGFMFSSGACFYLLREHIPMARPIFLGMLIAILVAIYSRAAFAIVYPLTITYVLLYCAFVPDGFIRKFNALGDYSYGIYIYAFPVQQTVIALMPGIIPGQLMLIATAATLPLAIASWHMVEHRALALKDWKPRVHWISN